jgi:hypothetical protein
MVIAAVFFLLLTFFVYWPMLPGDPHVMAGCACGDPALQSWFLGYFPWSLLHGHITFMTNYLDYPRGVNLATGTTMPLLALVFYPITLIFGATSTYSLLMWLAYPLSALSALYVVRKWTGSNIAAGLAGLVYGYSAYAIHQGYGHLNLSFVPLPPLIFYCVYNVLVTQPGRARRWGLSLGVLVSAQFLISSEIAFTTIIVAAIAALIWSIDNRREFTPRRNRYLIDALLPGAGLVIVVLAIPIWYQLFGTDRITAPASGTINNPYRADLLGAVIPTSENFFGPASLKAIADRFAGADPSENGAYLGVPMVLLFVGCWVRYFRHYWVQFTGFIALLCWVLSLGPWLIVDTHATSLRLPFYFLTRLPLMDNVLPVRLSLYVVFFVTLTLALSVATWTRDLPRSIETRERRSLSHWLKVGAVGILVVASLFALVPRSLPTQSTVRDTPAFFSLPVASRIPDGSVLLTYPYVYPNDDQALLWQLSSNFRWKVMGGYFVVPYPMASSAYPYPWPTPPTGVVDFLVHWELQGSPAGVGPIGPAPALDSVLIDQTRLFIRRYEINSVVVSLATLNAAHAVALFTDAFGHPTLAGGAAVWLGLGKTSR